jgi:hypothetical protein
MRMERQGKRMVLARCNHLRLMKMVWMEEYVYGGKGFEEWRENWMNGVE